MGFIFETNESDNVVNRLPTINNKKEKSFIENFSAAYNFSEYNNTSISESLVLQEEWQPIVDLIKQRKPRPNFIDKPSALLNSAIADPTINPGKYLSIGIFNEDQHLTYEKAVKNIKKYVEDNRDIFPDLVIDENKIYENAKKRALDSREKYNEITESSPSASNAIARFLGEAGSLVQDPVLLGTLFFSGFGPQNLLGASLKEAMLGAGAEAIIQSKVKDWYGTLGVDYSWEQFWTAVAFGGAIGGATPLAFKIGSKTFGLTVDQIKKGLKALSPKKGSSADLLQKAAEFKEDGVNSNPLNNKGVDEHVARLNEAETAVESNELPNLSEKPVAEVKPVKSVYDNEQQSGLIKDFDPDELLVDAETFQFKAGGDESGVTDRLRGVKKWDDIKAGVVVVYEYADGRKFIADGHQRLGLAKRLKSEGQPVTMRGFSLKEIDGFTPEMAMVSAALRNIAEGTGTAIDAAKVLRSEPGRISELPPRSNLVRQAKALVNLPNNLFGMVINDVVPAKYAAAVGRLIPDNPDLQEAAMTILAKRLPENEFQAESIVRQVIDAGFTKSEQNTLFGAELVPESYFMERAKVLDGAVKLLRQDKQAFSNLVNNAARLEAEGNVLARGANLERVGQDGQAIELLQAVANRKGSLSDALTEAAKVAKEEGYQQATRGFVNAVRNAVREGDFNRVAVSDVRRGIDDTTEVLERRVAADPKLENFDQPAGPGSRQQSDQLEQDLYGERRREGFTEDIELREDLKNKLEKGMSDADVDTHPAIIKALDDADKIELTNLKDGYLSDAWLADRTFNIDGMSLKGYSNGIKSLVARARVLSYLDSGTTPPSNYNVIPGKTAVILTGPPAAGKSTIANQVAKKLGAAIVDPDDAKKALPEFQGGLGANAVHEESSYIARTVQDILMNEDANLVIPKVGDNADKLRQHIQQLKNKGYKVILGNVDVSNQNALQRMLARFVKTGRLISPKYVRSIGNRPNENYKLLKREADGYGEIDNNGGFQDPKIIREDTDQIFEGFELERNRGPSDDRNIAKKPTEDSKLSFEETETTSLTDDPEFRFPTGTTDEAGEIIATTQTLKEIEEEIAQDQRMLDRLEGCVA